jgi:glycosyltransferase involved in cell wall biosynthesis
VKLVVLKPFVIARSNGGDISLIERLRLLHSWGVDIQVYIARPTIEEKITREVLDEFQTPLRRNKSTPLWGDSYTVDGIECRVEFGNRFNPYDTAFQHDLEKHFGDILTREQPDLVWTHYTDFFATTSALKWNADKTWVDLTDNEFPRLNQLATISSLGEPYQKISHMMVASAFMARQSRASFPKAEVIFTPNIIECLSENPISRDPRAWVFINPTPVKGVEFMLELAKALPKENFIFVGNWASESPANMPANVRFQPRQKNLSEVFKAAHGVLMPSVWQEAFGRVPLEAMAVGVPVITSDRGALPETVGDGGLCLPLEVKSWVEALSQPPTYWHTQIKKGFARAAQYREETTRHYDELRKRFESFSHAIGSR